LLRSGESSVIFDAGSSSTQRVADGIVEPALDEASVRQLDAIIISHPDLDHYSGVVRLINERSVRRLIVTERFLERAGETLEGTRLAWSAPSSTDRTTGSAPGRRRGKPSSGGSSPRASSQGAPSSRPPPPEATAFADRAGNSRVRADP